MAERYPIHELIEAHRESLGIRRGELARRCGFKNLSKGVGRIDGVCHGDLDSPAARMVLAALPAALGIDAEEVARAVKATAEIVAREEQKAAAECEAAWRASFKPCAYLVGTTSRPSQITIYGLSGGAERWLRIPLDLSQSPVTFAAQALAVVERTPTVPFFGPTTGFIVNYTPDRAVRFDLEGAAVEQFGRAYDPGTVEVFVGKQKIPAGWFSG